MENAKMKIEYRKLTDNESDPWLLLTNMDELIWNGVYALRVIEDDGSSGLPFRFENDDTVTLVLKDHSHEGMLQKARTVMQTITRVERSTGKVYNYTRTRYCVNGKHSWTAWEDTGGVDNSVIQQIGLNAQRIADEIARAQETELDISSKVDSIAKRHYSNIPHVNIGVLQQGDEPYPGTSYCAYSDKITGAGEIVVADGYYIDIIKIIDKDGTESDFQNDCNDLSYEFAIDYDFQLGFRKKDNSAFSEADLNRVVQNFRLYPVKWNKYFDINNYNCTGVYNLYGTRTSNTDNMPISSIGSFEARLTVMATGSSVMQVLMLIDATGNGNIYRRIKQSNAWSEWSALF